MIELLSLLGNFIQVLLYYFIHPGWSNTTTLAYRATISYYYTNYPLLTLVILLPFIFIIIKIFWRLLKTI